GRRPITLRPGDRHHEGVRPVAFGGTGDEPASGAPTPKVSPHDDHQAIREQREVFHPAGVVAAELRYPAGLEGRRMMSVLAVSSGAHRPLTESSTPCAGAPVTLG